MLYKSIVERILVTGGAGFVGSNLIETLARDSFLTIMSVDNYSTGHTRNHIGGVNYINASTLDIKPIIDDFRPNVVFHLGEYSRIVSSFDDFEECHASNIQGTFEVANACRLHGAKLVYAGSSSKFGNSGADENLSPYAWMKAKNAELIKNIGDWFGLNYAITYFYNVYGQRQIEVGPMATVIGIFQQCVLKNQVLPVVSPGTQSRIFTHVNDVVAGLICVAKRGEGDGFLLGADESYSLIDVAKLFKHPYELTPERRGERFASQIYSGRIQDLGWKAQHSLADYVDEWLFTHNLREIDSKSVDTPTY